MTDESVDLNSFIVALCEAAYRWVKESTNDLTEDQVFYQPAEDTNSIGWLIWHLSRWRDNISAAVAGEPQVWVSEGWDKRFGITAERTGLGDTLEQVASFRVDRDILLGYAEAAHNAIVSRVSHFTLEQLEKPIEYVPGSSRPAWRALISVMEDSAEHTGQINYLRGMVAGYGWR
ncbi:MAG: DinB family protein [Dehalococcoidia bacterium]